MLDAAGDVQVVLGSAGSNRIRSAILQAIVAVVDHGADAQQAVDAPRLHLEGETVFLEPGAAPAGWAPGGGRQLSGFRDRNLFFGGVQAVKGVSFEVNPGECVALIGPNGAGKSTTFACIAGQHGLTQGEVRWAGQRVDRLRPAPRPKLPRIHI